MRVCSGRIVVRDCKVIVRAPLVARVTRVSTRGCIARTLPSVRDHRCVRHHRAAWLSMLILLTQPSDGGFDMTAREQLGTFRITVRDGVQDLVMLLHRVDGDGL